MNALFDTEALRAEHRGQLFLDDVEVVAEQPVAEQPVEPVVVEHQGGALFALALTDEPVDGALFGVTVAEAATIEPTTVEPVHGDVATCGARGYRKVTCPVCWPNVDRCGWGNCTRSAPIAVVDAAGDEMPVCRRCVRHAQACGYREIGTGRA
jgi:hypothetical protein